MFYVITGIKKEDDKTYYLIDIGHWNGTDNLFIEKPTVMGEEIAIYHYLWLMNNDESFVKFCREEMNDVSLLEINCVDQYINNISDCVLAMEKLKQSGLSKLTDDEKEALKLDKLYEIITKW